MAVVKRAFSLGNANFGSGKPVLIGSLFYKSDRKVKDHGRGIVDRNALSRELKQVGVLKARVGLDHALDVIAETPRAMENYLEVLADETKDPLLIGGLNEETRVAGYRKAMELDIVERCGVNSVASATTEEELARIRETGIGFAIVQTLDPSAVLPREKIDLLGGGLLGMCSNAGLKNVAVDVGIMDFTSAWLAAEAIRMISSELGIPAGCAPSNAAYQPLGSGRVSRKTARSMNVALNTMMQLAGADFIIYGPLKASSYVFEAAAMVEGIKGYGARASGKKMPDRDHPLFRYLPKLSQ
jgi:tetrahydromethanopterin S-methyltransferase subunit H